ncbi:MAG: hypothetical protein JW987_13430 [Anaerolineaceae bacterium]|nr:hypothetical protein [Anaerolineaceae bacterium]
MAENVTPKQQICITALMTGGTIEQAANTANVSPRTVYRWMHDDEIFKVALEAARNELVRGALGRLSALLGEGADELQKLLKSSRTTPAQRIKVVNAIFTNHARLHETTLLSARLDRIEEMLNDPEATN